MISEVLVSPILQLLGLFALSTVIRRLWMTPGESPAASGAIVMAGGIAVLDALQQVPLPVASITRWATLALLVLGSFIGGSYVASWLHGTFHRHTDLPIDSFAIGTWVAAVSVLAQTVVLALPAWRPFAIVLGLLSLIIWIRFLLVAMRAFGAIVHNPRGQHVTGRILLSTVATQSLATLAVTLFPSRLPLLLLAPIVALGYLLYLLGATLVVERYFPSRRWNLADDWDTTNCILHGAMSISGLAGILTGVLSTPWIDASWLWAGGMLVAVEAVEVARARSRVRRYGWREGLLTYHVTQWARTFTLGMFYAFTLHLPTAARYNLPVIDSLRTPIVNFGQYVVLGLLLAETGLFVRWTIRRHAGGSQMRSFDTGKA